MARRLLGCDWAEMDRSHWTAPEFFVLCFSGRFERLSVSKQLSVILLRVGRDSAILLSCSVSGVVRASLVARDVLPGFVAATVCSERVFSCSVLTVENV